MAAAHVAGTIKDPTIKFVTLQIEGEAYRLAWSFGAIARAEYDLGQWVEEQVGEKNGKPLYRRVFQRADLLNSMAKFLTSAPSAIDILGLFYAGLKTAHPKITREKVESLITLDNLVDIQTAIIQSWGLSAEETKSLPGPTEGGADAPPSS